jgi:hypothetical protein
MVNQQVAQTAEPVQVLKTMAKEMESMHKAIRMKKTVSLLKKKKKKKKKKEESKART